MTISSVRVFGAENGISPTKGSPKPPAQMWNAPDFPFRDNLNLPAGGFAETDPETAIVIDNGSSLIRAGWSTETAPRLSIPPIMARFSDRKVNRRVLYAGYDAYADATTRGQIKNAFEPGTSIVTNWDVMEGVLDYTFQRLGIESNEGSVERPIVMTEPIANLRYTRKTMSELLFECYTAPSVAFGIDALFSYRQNWGKSGLVISSSHSSTHLIPVVDSRPIMSSVSRLNWGGFWCAEYLSKLLRLKYPPFPGKITETQIQDFVREHCYVSQDFEPEMQSYLDWTGLEARDRVIQYPFTEHVVAEKTEEELARIAERKKESGRRLQEQNARNRLERLMKEEAELNRLKFLQVNLEGQTKKETRRVLDEEAFKDEAALERRIQELDKSIRKKRNKDLGGPENEAEEEEKHYPLLDVPDDQLDEAGLKEKRHQRLMKSGAEARARAKLEKQQEKARQEDAARIDQEWRENDPEAWLNDKRQTRIMMLDRIRDRDRAMADVGNRKSLASQQRMKTLANLASDQPGRKRRRGGGDDDDFGMNDEDWGVYRSVQMGTNEPMSDDEEEEDLDEGVRNIEALLLQHDPNFTEQHTLAAKSDWSKSLYHAYVRGPRPFDPDSQKEKHQLHVNVERIRVPEVVFKPGIAGVDQAGVVEIAADIFMQRLGSSEDRDAVLKDIFLTGGNTLFAGFDERLDRELRTVLPSDAVVRLRKAKDPLLDAWRGAAAWTRDEAYRNARITREEYFEKGPEYLKDHDYGNQFGM